MKTVIRLDKVSKSYTLGEKKITIEETEKDRFVVTTTTETAHSKKN